MRKSYKRMLRIKAKNINDFTATNWSCLKVCDQRIREKIPRSSAGGQFIRNVAQQLGVIRVTVHRQLRNIEP